MSAFFSIMSALAALWFLYKRKDDPQPDLNAKKALIGMSFFIGMILFVAFVGAIFGKLGINLHPQFAIVVFTLFFVVVAIKGELNETQEVQEYYNKTLNGKTNHDNRK